MKFSEDVVEEEVIKYHYIWEDSLQLFSIYKIVTNYLTENYSIDSLVLIELIKANNLSMTDSLHNIPYIHSGYVEVIIENRTETNGE